MTLPADVHDVVPAELAGPRAVVEVTTTYLEMRAPPSSSLGPPPASVQVVRAAPPTLRFYRYLYDAIGERWAWYDRRRMPPEELAAIVDDSRVEVHVLWKAGVPAGYAELDRRAAGQVELTYFGLLPEAIGQRLGPWLLGWAIREAWRPGGVTRVWLHTCTLDHPSALPMYVAAGFVPYGEERHRQTVVVRSPDAAPPARG